MALNLGNTEPSTYYLGSNPVSEIYFGDSKVWPVSVFGSELLYYDPSSSLSYLWPTGANSQYRINNISANKNSPILGVSPLFGGLSASIEAMRNSLTASTIIVEDPSGSGKVIKYGNFAFSGGSNSNWFFEDGSYPWSFVSGSKVSFEAWIRPYAKPGPITPINTINTSPIFSLGQYTTLGISSPGTNDGALFYESRQNGFISNESHSLWTPSASISFKQWNHIVMSVQGIATGSNQNHQWQTASINLYVNGVKMSAQSSSQFTPFISKFNGSAQSVTIGKGTIQRTLTVAYAYMDSSMIRVYNKTLNDNDVLDLFNNTKARYGFNEFTGSTIKLDPATYTNNGVILNSVTSNPVTGTLNGSIQYTSSVAGGVFNFARTSIYNPNTNYIQFPTYNFGNEATFMAWVYPKGQLPGGSIQTLLANTTNWSESNGFKLTWDPYFADANAMGFENGDGIIGAPYNTTTGSVIDNQWQHLAWSYNKTTSTLKMYRNGELRPYLNPSGPGSYDLKNFTTSNAFVIGGMFERTPPPTVNYEFQMNAMLGVIKITNSELPAQTILDDYLATKARYGV